MQEFSVAKGRLRSYLEKLRVGSTINREKLAEKFGMTSQREVDLMF